MMNHASSLDTVWDQLEAAQTLEYEFGAAVRAKKSDVVP